MSCVGDQQREEARHGKEDPYLGRHCLSGLLRGVPAECGSRRREDIGWRAHRCWQRRRRLLQQSGLYVRMTGALGPEEPEEQRRERDTEQIPRTRAEAHPPPDEADERATHFVGTARVGAYATPGATGSPI